MSPLLDRFLRYARLDTAADESSDAVPSTAKQLVLSRMLADECRTLGLTDVELADTGTVYATVPASPGCENAPTFALFAHVDTSPEAPSAGIAPRVVENYPGGDIPLGESGRVIREADHPDLPGLVGTTLVVTDGTTLLGGDDKCGVAVAMTAAEELLAGLPSGEPAPHGPVRLVFTCDEEVGRGTEGVDLAKVGAVCGYTLDGDSSGKVDAETFSADLAVVTVRGVNTHPSRGKGVMVNALRVLAAFLDRLPRRTLAPEVTDGRDGFVHPYHVGGGVAEATARLILRSFETAELAEQAALLETIAADLRAEYPRAEIAVDVTPQYRNMRDGMDREPRAVPLAVAATEAAGLAPRRTIIRGGTDGALLTALGLPCPNFSCGQHAMHTPLEWTSEKQMADAVRVVLELARLWGREER